MRNVLTPMALLLLTAFSAEAQTMKNDDLNEKVAQIEDRIALKELVDTFSILADKKDMKAQTQLFTADGIVETFVNGARVANLKGRKAMEEAFGSFLKSFKTVYHFNGQQTLTINGDKASGISYCMVTLIGTENGKSIKTTIGVIYQDEYVRENSRWLIAKRTSTFDWQDKRELGR